MKRILVPLDGSLLAEAILPVAEEWAREEEAEVILLWATRAYRGVGGDDTGPQMWSVEEGEAYLKAVADRLERRGLREVRRLVWYQEPVTAITQAAVAKTVDLIAMATHGRSGLSRLLLGSVALGVARSARLPMLLIRGQSAWKPWAHRKMLVPLDGSETSEAILPVVGRLAGSRNLRVTLLHVLEPARSGVLQPEIGLDEWMTVRRRDADRHLAKVAESLRDRRVRVECAVRFGRPVETIVAVAGQEREDLIAMVTHGRRGLGRLFFGSVAEEVLRRAAVPVLLFKAAESGQATSTA